MEGGGYSAKTWFFIIEMFGKMQVSETNSRKYHKYITGKCSFRDQIQSGPGVSIDSPLEVKGCP